MNFKGKILSKIESTDQYLSELDTLLPDTEQIYLTNLEKRRACEKTLELAIENVIGIISIIVSHQKLGLPSSEDDLVNLLVQNKIITNKLATKIKLMKGFRNILVHKYGDLEDKLAYQFMVNEIVDFDLFFKEIKLFVNKNK